MNIIKSNISEKFEHNGVLIKSCNDKDNLIKFIDENDIIREFEQRGLVIFEDFDINKKNLTDLTDKFTQNYASDTNRRESRFGSKIVKSVDTGNDKIKLHSEASFTSTWPEIIWFYCHKAPNIGAETTLCDGIKLWNELTKETQKFFIQNPIVYKLSIPIRAKKNGKGTQDWCVKNIGTNNSYINWDLGELFLEQSRYAVHNSRNMKDLCFANHIIVDLKSEPQIVSRTLVDGKEIPKDIMDEVILKSDNLTYKHSWKNNQLIMLDNKRFLHGREKILPNQERDIVNIQSQFASFAYGQTTRKKVNS